MSHAAHESSQRVSRGSARSGVVMRGARGRGATGSIRGEQPSALEAQEGDIAVPELTAFAGAKRMQLAALTKSRALTLLLEEMDQVTRVASMRPQTFGWAQTLARLRAVSRPAGVWF
ncbi:hypothetical protein MYSTI_00525 [Myxococcus stipitatus DSM 14675]|uniref:Uncharacterized protein n=2 Tax=Myxococcus stipitatus TaxID=83455 RepID=L7U233_MYXSD|nr:hypothetical protein MYSTI_00525 [Myxococcus stipitatus DSM 14675]